MGVLLAEDAVARGETPGRHAIAVEEAVDRYGPWVVLRVRRPR
jgi:hypothetical protein